MVHVSTKQCLMALIVFEMMIWVKWPDWWSHRLLFIHHIPGTGGIDACVCEAILWLLCLPVNATDDESVGPELDSAIDQSFFSSLPFNVCVCLCAEVTLNNWSGASFRPNRTPGFQYTHIFSPLVFLLIKRKKTFCSNSITVGLCGAGPHYPPIIFAFRWLPQWKAPHV